MAQPYLVIRQFIPTISGTGIVVMHIAAFDGDGNAIPETERNIQVPADVLTSTLNQLPPLATMDDAYALVAQAIAQLAPDLSLDALQARVDANKASTQAIQDIADMLVQYGLTVNTKIPAVNAT